MLRAMENARCFEMFINCAIPVYCRRSATCAGFPGGLPKNNKRYIVYQYTVEEP